MWHIYIDVENHTYNPTLWAEEPSNDERRRRTTNGCESFHSHFNAIFNSTHPQHIHILARVKTVSAAGVHLHQNAGYAGSIVSQRADESWLRPMISTWENASRGYFSRHSWKSSKSENQTRTLDNNIHFDACQPAIWVWHWSFFIATCLHHTNKIQFVASTGLISCLGS